MSVAELRGYSFVHRLSAAIVALEWIAPKGIKRDLWTRQKLRKSVKCAVTSRAIETGGQAWSPVTNGNNRMDRISDEGMTRLEKKKARSSHCVRPKAMSPTSWRS